MPVYERSVRVAAPLEEVWQFHSGIEGLEALTPGWMNLQVESVRGPDGEPDPEIMETGAVAETTVRPFGVGPRQGWTSEIVARERYDGSAYFRDEMSDGPFREWTHTHLFYADGDETIVRDRVEYRLPLGGLGDAVGPLAKVGFEPMFRFRHKTTKDLLE
jgi:ligand-binding SRPBCC domain-containing protein